MEIYSFINLAQLFFLIYFTFVLLSDIKRLIQEMQLVSDMYVMKYAEKYWGVLASLDGRQGSVWLSVIL